MVSLDLPPTASTKWPKRQPSHGVSEMRQRRRSIQLLPNTRLCSPSSQGWYLWDQGWTRVGRDVSEKWGGWAVEEISELSGGRAARPQEKLPAALRCDSPDTYLLSMLPLTMRLGGLSRRLTQVKSPSALPSFERQRSASRLYTRIWGGGKTRGWASGAAGPHEQFPPSVAPGHGHGHQLPLEKRL